MDNNNIPNHVAIILDGNRRWAKDRGKPQLYGHQKGFENIRKISEYIYDKGVNVLSVYAFSTENMNRSEEEVKYLMDLFVREFKKEYSSFDKENIKVIFSGRKDNLRKDVIEAMEQTEEKTKNNTRGIFNVCLNYGGRFELIDAFKKMHEDAKNGKLDINNLEPEDVNKYMYHELPPIDLMIRTSGELRLSNFLLWQNAYAEFYFPNCHWPAFDETEFDKAIEEFQRRNRRFGGDAK